MNILITNDDGINAIGIRRLAEKLKILGNITVIAPDRERSATGHAITMHQPLRVEKIDTYSDGVFAWSISGTPSDCIKIGIESILSDKPDIIVSGINNGPNLGTDVIYSGTVSAAIEGAIHGIPSIALSVAGRKGEINYDAAVKYSSELVKLTIKHCKDKNLILNINVPSISEESIKGIRLTELGIRKYSNTFIKREDPLGKNYYWLAGNLIEIQNNDQSDVKAIENGFISITPLHYDLTDYRILEELNKADFSI
ncbi:5'/3'-nucleotidase SurE [Brassicibacter mesophilus]|jgi:5'/3'-nucleotidase|uniref:5'/3'-nucleotidase SurE n=1 Tax=Brassicibacter mesophilus TaxID=745119 RepID=UPI003D2634C7